MRMNGKKILTKIKIKHLTKKHTYEERSMHIHRHIQNNDEETRKKYM